jgi:hypothetical protein
MGGGHVSVDTATFEDMEKGMNETYARLDELLAS